MTARSEWHISPGSQGQSRQDHNPLHIAQPSLFSPEKSIDLVYVIDPDPDLRAKISVYLVEAGNRVVALASASEFLSFYRTGEAACVILNACLPDISGFELQRRIAGDGNHAIIFVSDQCDIPSVVFAMKAGALEFFTSPVDLAALCVAVRSGLAQAHKMRQGVAELLQLRERLRLLTPREREVLPLVVGGMLNKQAASVLGISEVTLQIHRSQVMRKMQADSLPDLVRMAVKLRVPHRRWKDCLDATKPLDGRRTESFRGALAS